MMLIFFDAKIQYCIEKTLFSYRAFNSEKLQKYRYKKN